MATTDVLLLTTGFLEEESSNETTTTTHAQTTITGVNQGGDLSPTVFSSSLNDFTGVVQTITSRSFTGLGSKTDRMTDTTNISTVASGVLGSDDDVTTVGSVLIEGDDGISNAVILGASIGGGVIVLAILIVILLMLIQNKSCQCCCCRDDSSEAGKIHPNRPQSGASVPTYGGRLSFRRERSHAPGIENPVYDDDKQHTIGPRPHPPGSRSQKTGAASHSYASANRYEPAGSNRMLAEQNVHKTGRPPLSGAVQNDSHNVQIVTTPMEAMQTMRPQVENAHPNDSANEFYDDSEFDDFDYEYVPRGYQAPVQLTHHKQNRPIEEELRHHSIYASAVQAGHNPLDQPIYGNVETLKIRGDAKPEYRSTEHLDQFNQRPGIYDGVPKEHDQQSQVSTNSSEIMRRALKRSDSPVGQVTLSNEDFVPSPRQTIQRGYSDDRDPSSMGNLRRIDSMEDIRDEMSYRPTRFMRGEDQRVSISRAKSLDDLMEDRNAPIGIITVPGLRKNKYKSTPMFSDEFNQRHSVAGVESVAHAQHQAMLRSKPLQNNIPKESPVAVLKPQRRPYDIPRDDSPPPPFRAPPPAQLQRAGRVYASTSVLDTSPRHAHYGPQLGRSSTNLNDSRHYSTDNLSPRHREPQQHYAPPSYDDSRRGTPLYNGLPPDRQSHQLHKGAPRYASSPNVTSPRQHGLQSRPHPDVLLEEVPLEQRIPKHRSPSDQMRSARPQSADMSFIRPQTERNQTSRPHSEQVPRSVRPQSERNRSQPRRPRLNNADGLQDQHDRPSTGPPVRQPSAQEELSQPVRPQPAPKPTRPQIAQQVNEEVIKNRHANGIYKATPIVITRPDQTVPLTLPNHQNVSNSEC